jgi:hypothetical protein
MKNATSYWFTKTHALHVMEVLLLNEQEMQMHVFKCQFDCPSTWMYEEHLQLHCLALKKRQIEGDIGFPAQAVSNPTHQVVTQASVVKVIPKERQH